MSSVPEPTTTSGSHIDGHLVFEVAGVALALPLAAVSRVLERRPVRTLPHQAGRSVLGIVALEGELRLCGSLLELCGLQADADGARAGSRLLVIGSGSRAWVAPVDVVIGVVEVGDAAGVERADGEAGSGATPVQSVFQHEHRRVLLLDPDRLLEEFERRIP